MDETIQIERRWRRAVVAGCVVTVVCIAASYVASWYITKAVVRSGLEHVAKQLSGSGVD